MNHEQKLLVALAYVLWPVAFVLLLVEEAKEEDKSREVRHHAFNALGFWVAVLICSLFVSVFAFIPLFGTIVVILFVVVVILMALMLAAAAYKGKRAVIPYVTQFLKNNVKDF